MDTCVLCVSWVQDDIWYTPHLCAQRQTVKEEEDRHPKHVDDNIALPDIQCCKTGIMKLNRIFLKGCATEQLESQCYIPISIHMLEGLYRNVQRRRTRKRYHIVLCHMCCTVRLTGPLASCYSEPHCVINMHLHLWSRWSLKRCNKRSKRWCFVSCCFGSWLEHAFLQGLCDFFVSLQGILGTQRLGHRQSIS